VTSAQWKAATLLVGVFLLGGITGVGGTLAFVAHERAELGHFDLGRRGEVQLHALSRHLNLTAEQRKKVSALLEQRGPMRQQAMRNAMEKCGDSLKEEKGRLDKEIRALLDPQQQARFDEISAKQDERMFLPGHGLGRRMGREQ
jgi:Spy/CpxP family protein refolding chaperone